MARTETVSKTVTFTRIDMIKKQFNHALLYGSSLEKEYIDKLVDCIEKRYITRFELYGMNNDDLCEIHYNLEIDWDAFEVKFTHSSQVEVSDRTTENGVSRVIADYTELFCDYCSSNGLRKALQWTYSDFVYDNHELRGAIREYLNSSDAQTPEFVEGVCRPSTFKVYEVSEMSGSIRFK